MIDAIKTKPLPLLDTLEYLPKQELPAQIVLNFAAKDFAAIKSFLLQYQGSIPTFEAYRRELERLIQWSWFVNKKSILELTRADIENYLAFCLAPPANWIGLKRVARFIEQDSTRVPNPEWRPFVAALSKAENKNGKVADVKNFKLSQEAINAIFIGLSSFYNYLLTENLVAINPIAQIRQKSKYLRKQQGKRKVRRLTEIQWDAVIETASLMAKENPEKHERTLFIMTALYLMYLRISELVAHPRWQPQMGHFYRDSRNNWWFKTVGKGNKARDITVCDAMLAALKRYRQSLDLSPPLPLPNETTPLISKFSSAAHEPISSERQIRFIVQDCFDRTILRLQQDNLIDEAKSLEAATVHWLRHTGISDDINKRGRPMAHVRDDAGHSSSATTDRYNDIELQARHDSAKNKQVDD